MAARSGITSGAKPRRWGVRVLILLVVAGGIAGGALFLLNDDDDTSKAKGPDGAAAETTTTTLAEELAGIDCSKAKPDAADAEKKRYDAAPEAQIDTARKYRATIETSCGTIVAELDPTDPFQSPTGINNFVFLAREGFYDGLTWHRVVNEFVVQSGAPGGDPAGDAGYDFGSPEDAPEGITYGVGDLAFANAAGDTSTSGSQFFIVTGEFGPSSLNSQPIYIKFGKVVEGLDVAQRLAAFEEAGTQAPSQTLYIMKVTIEEI